MTEFNLSEKRKFVRKNELFNKLKIHALDKHKVYPEEDIKEFIRLLKEEMKNVQYPFDVYKYLEKIDKLAGDSLK